MSSYKHDEFRAFCTYPDQDARFKKTFIKKNRAGEPKFQAGNLLMEGDLVWSYNMLIGIVDRQHKIVLTNMKAVGVSRTTSMHLGSMNWLPTDWISLPVPRLEQDANAFATLLHTYPSLIREDWPTVRSFHSLLEQFNWHKSMWQPVLEEYISADASKREAMQGLYELELEARKAKALG